MPDEPRKPPKLEAGEPLKQVDDYEDEREQMRSYYPNLRSDVTPRDWDEPPWGHRKEKAWLRRQT